jgi:hypothetical protein
MPKKQKDLETESKKLKAQVAKLSQTEDYIEIWQLMSMYSHLYHVFKRSEIPGPFARKTPGVLVEIEDSGVYEGLEGVDRFFNGVLSEKRHMVPGFLGVHMTVNPIIQFNKKKEHGPKESGIPMEV